MPHNSAPFDFRRELNAFERKRRESRGIETFEDREHLIGLEEIIARGQTQARDEAEKRADAGKKASSGPDPLAGLPKPDPVTGDPAQSARSGLADFLKGEGTETITETPGETGGGVPPKFIKTTTETDRPFPGSLGLFLRSKSSSETQRLNPAREKAANNRALILGESMAANGGIPDKALLAQVQKNFGADAGPILSQAKANMVQILETNKKQKFEAGKASIGAAIQAGWKVGPEGTDAIFDYTYADTTAEVGAAVGALEKMRRASPAGLIDTFNQQTAFIQMQEAETNRDLNLAKAEVDGLIVTGAGLHGKMTDQQIFTNLKDITFADGKAGLSPTVAGLAVTLQLEQAARDGNVNLFVDDWVGQKDISSHQGRNIINDFVIMEGRGFAKSGAIVTSDDQADFEATLKERRGAAKRLGALGVVTEVLEDGSTGLGIQEGSLNSEVLTRLLLIGKLVRAKEVERGIIILNAYSWKPGEDVFEGFGEAPDILFPQVGEPARRDESARRAKARDRGDFVRGATAQSIQAVREAAKQIAEKDPIIRDVRAVKDIGGGFLEGLFPNEERR